MKRKGANLMQICFEDLRKLKVETLNRKRYRSPNHHLRRLEEERKRAVEEEQQNLRRTALSDVLIYCELIVEYRSDLTDPLSR